jgi:hypothetical protein
VDKVIGPLEEYQLWMFKGETDGIEYQGAEIVPGLNIFLPPDFLDDGQGGQRMSYEEWKEDPVLYITLGDDPDRQALMCQESIKYALFLSKLVSCDQPPEDAIVTCDDDRRSYTANYPECEQESICAPINCAQIIDSCELDPTDPVPDDWPCPQIDG